jgi:hypothetical protein
VKFCQPHWEKLRAAIDERGLTHLVAQGGAQAARNLAAESRDGPSIQTFDPLMAAHNAIWFNAMQTPVGMTLMFANDDGSERCPICFPRDEHAKVCPGAPECLVSASTFEAWIDLAAEGAKEQADELLRRPRIDA